MIATNKIKRLSSQHYSVWHIIWYQFFLSYSLQFINTENLNDSAFNHSEWMRGEALVPLKQQTTLNTVCLKP